jgi:hypothetical protein
MFSIVSIKEPYVSYAADNNPGGFCFGLCLTWLGDILKQRPEQRSWFSGWGNSPLKPEQKALLPSSPARMRYFFERALRKQINYQKQYELITKHVKNSNKHEALILKYKNLKQCKKQLITGDPRLEYNTFGRNDFMQYTGLNNYGPDYPLSGIMITFILECESGKTGGHCVAAFRWSESDTYVLDPNEGLYKCVSKNPMQEISHYLKSTYKNTLAVSEITISRQI